MLLRVLVDENMPEGSDEVVRQFGIGAENAEDVLYAGAPDFPTIMDEIVAREWTLATIDKGFSPPAGHYARKSAYRNNRGIILLRMPGVRRTGLEKQALRKALLEITRWNYDMVERTVIVNGKSSAMPIRSVRQIFY